MDSYHDVRNKKRGPRHTRAHMRLEKLMRSMHKRSGFTLIELMVVVVIIAALAGMVLPRVLPASTEAKVNIAKGDMASISVALKMFKLHNDRYPTTAEGLGALVQAPASSRNWKGPYLDRVEMPKDPWREEYLYRFPGVNNSYGFDIWSLGPDGVEGSDDVNNWEH